MRLDLVEGVPAHVRDLEGGIARLDAGDLAGDPAEALGHLVFAAAFGHELHADADAEKRPAAPAHGVVERLDHAGQGIEAAPAVGEGADARKHDAIGRTDLRPDRRSPRSARHGSLSRAARSNALAAECRLPEP